MLVSSDSWHSLCVCMLHAYMVWACRQNYLSSNIEHCLLALLQSQQQFVEYSLP